MNEKYVLGWEEAMRFFDEDEEMQEFLNSLDEYEREGFVLEICMYEEGGLATWSLGHRWRTTDHLYLKNDRYDNAPTEEDDYDGVREKIHEIYGGDE